MILGGEIKDAKMSSFSSGFLYELLMSLRRLLEKQNENIIFFFFVPA